MPYVQAALAVRGVCVSQSEGNADAKYYHDVSARLRLEAARAKSDKTSLELLSIAAMFELLAHHQRELAEATKREELRKENREENR